MIKESNARTLSGVEAEEIDKAELALDFRFNTQFRLFLKEFGAMSVGSNEIFGLGISGHMNIVEATKEAREIHKKSLSNLVVIQDYGIGDILITMDEKGFIYESREDENKKIYDSFEEFLKQEIL